MKELDKIDRKLEIGRSNNKQYTNVRNFIVSITQNQKKNLEKKRVTRMLKIIKPTYLHKVTIEIQILIIIINIIKKERNRLEMNSIMIFLAEVMITKNSLKMRRNMEMKRYSVMKSFSIIHLERIIQRIKRRLMRFMIELALNSLIQKISV